MKYTELSVAKSYKIFSVVIIILAALSVNILYIQYI